MGAPAEYTKKATAIDSLRRQEEEIRRTRERLEREVSPGPRMEAVSAKPGMSARSRLDSLTRRTESTERKRRSKCDSFAHCNQSLVIRQTTTPEKAAHQNRTIMILEKDGEKCYFAPNTDGVAERTEFLLPYGHPTLFPENRAGSVAAATSTYRPHIGAVSKQLAKHRLSRNAPPRRSQV